MGPQAEYTTGGSSGRGRRFGSSMRYSFAATFSQGAPEPDGLITWTTTYGAVALACTTAAGVDAVVATADAWNNDESRKIGVERFEASTPVELGLLIDQSGLLAPNVIVASPEQQDQLFRESGGRMPPQIVIAFEGDPLFEHTFDEWIR